MSKLTADHVAMGIAINLKVTIAGNSAVALLVAADGTLHAAIDRSSFQRGHTAVVNLVQHCRAKEVPLDGVRIYLAGAPSDADLGIYIEQVHGSSWLFTRENGVTYSRKPSKSAKEGGPRVVAAPMGTPVSGVSKPAPLQNGNSWWAWVDRTGEFPQKLKTVLTTLDGKLEYRVDVSEDSADLIRTLLSTTAKQVGKYGPGIVAVPDALKNVICAGSGGGFAYDSLGKDEKSWFDAIFMLTAYSLTSVRTQTVQESGRPLSDVQGNPVGAVLVESSGRIRSWGVNTGGTLHAEVNVVKYYQEHVSKVERFATGARLYTTLEPCFMCSGLLSAYKGNGFTVIYGQEDPACRAQGRTTFLKQLPTLYEPTKGATYQSGARVPYGGTTGTFASKLAIKRVEMANAAYEAGAEEAGEAFALSAIEALKQDSMQRRFAKATLQLARLGATIAGSSAKNRQALLQVWKDAVQLIGRAGGHVPSDGTIDTSGLKALLDDTGGYLDDTVGRNQWPSDWEAYKKRKRVPEKYAKQAEQVLGSLQGVL